MSVARLTSRLPPHLARCLADTRPPYYLHRLNPWAWRTLMAFLLALAAAGQAFVIARAIQGNMGIAEWMLGLFLLPFLLLLARPVTWRSPVAMVADSQGLWFISGRGEEEPVFVPWAEVGTMGIERHVTSNGMSRTVVLGIRGDSSFWAPATESRYMRHLLQPVQPDGYRRLPIGNQGVGTRRTLAALAHLRALSAGPAPRS